jgi:hypothetical protein
MWFTPTGEPWSAMTVIRAQKRLALQAACLESKSDVKQG